MTIALVIALGLNQKLRARGLYRVAYYMPQVTATVAVATVWLWIYQPGAGLADALLSLVELGPPPWLTSSVESCPVGGARDFG
jgi:multiple sugar transport system permease protein